MGRKLLWTGLTLMLAVSKFLPITEMTGAIIMIIGCILMWLDK